MNDERDEMPKILRDKFDEIVVPKEIFQIKDFDEKIKAKKCQRLKKKVAMYVTILVIVFVGILGISFIKSRNDVNGNRDSLANSNDTFIEEVNANLRFFSISKTNYFSIVKVDSIEGYYVIDDIAYTKIKVTSVKDYKNNTLKNSEVYVVGGIFNSSDVNNIIEEEFDENTKVKINYDTLWYISNVEVGQEYVITLFELNGKNVVDYNFQYGFNKYNPENNTVEISENNYEELVIEDYMIK